MAFHESYYVALAAAAPVIALAQTFVLTRAYEYFGESDIEFEERGRSRLDTALNDEDRGVFVFTFQLATFTFLAQCVALFVALMALRNRANVGNDWLENLWGGLEVLGLLAVLIESMLMPIMDARIKHGLRRKRIARKPGSKPISDSREPRERPMRPKVVAPRRAKISRARRGHK